MRDMLWLGQAWWNELQRIICEFVQDDQELGEFLLDHCNFDSCFDAGITPQQSLDTAIARLKSSDAFAAFLKMRGREQ